MKALKIVIEIEKMKYPSDLLYNSFLFAILIKEKNKI